MSQSQDAAIQAVFRSVNNSVLSVSIDSSWTVLYESLRVYLSLSLFPSLSPFPLPPSLLSSTSSLVPPHPPLPLARSPSLAELKVG